MPLIWVRRTAATAGDRGLVVEEGTGRRILVSPVPSSSRRVRVGVTREWRDSWKGPWRPLWRPLELTPESARKLGAALLRMAETVDRMTDETEVW